MPLLPRNDFQYGARPRMPQVGESRNLSRPLPQRPNPIPLGRRGGELGDLGSSIFARQIAPPEPPAPAVPRVREPELRAPSRQQRPGMQQPMLPNRAVDPDASDVGTTSEGSGNPNAGGLPSTAPAGLGLSTGVNAGPVSINANATGKIGVSLTPAINAGLAAVGVNPATSDGKAVAALANGVISLGLSTRGVPTGLNVLGSLAPAIAPALSAAGIGLGAFALAVTIAEAMMSHMGIPSINALASTVTPASLAVTPDIDAPPGTSAQDAMAQAAPIAAMMAQGPIALPGIAMNSNDVALAASMPGSLLGGLNLNGGVFGQAPGAMSFKGPNNTSILGLARGEQNFAPQPTNRTDEPTNAPPGPPPGLVSAPPGTADESDPDAEDEGGQLSGPPPDEGGGAGGGGGAGCFLANWSLDGLRPQDAAHARQFFAEFYQQFMADNPRGGQRAFLVYQAIARKIIAAAQRQGPDAVRQTQQYIYTRLVRPTGAHLERHELNRAVLNMTNVVMTLAKRFGIPLPKMRQRGMQRPK